MDRWPIFAFACCDDMYRLALVGGGALSSSLTDTFQWCLSQVDLSRLPCLVLPWVLCPKILELCGRASRYQCWFCVLLRVWPFLPWSHVKLFPGSSGRVWWSLGFRWSPVLAEILWWPSLQAFLHLCMTEFPESKFSSPNSESDTDQHEFSIPSPNLNLPYFWFRVRFGD